MPAGYDELNDHRSPRSTFVNIDALAEGTAEIHHRSAGSVPTVHGGSASITWRVDPLADMLPLLDQLGLRALDERAFGFVVRLRTGVVARCRCCRTAGRTAERRDQAEVQRSFSPKFSGSIEVDGLNRLVILGGLTSRQIEILRAYSRYLRQIGFSFSQQYIEAAMVRHAQISRLLAALFTARFDPLAVDDIIETESALRAEIDEALDGVPSLDDDRTLRTLSARINATVAQRVRPASGRLSAGAGVQVDTSKGSRPSVAAPHVRDLVCSPRVEGVHLRNGRSLAGGIRWSDRREDFRTEILGLVKAQIVKNGSSSRPGPRADSC